jgi:hypothetical protein
MVKSIGRQSFDWVYGVGKEGEGEETLSSNFFLETVWMGLPFTVVRRIGRETDFLCLGP